MAHRAREARVSDQITDALAAIGETAIWWREQAEAMERQRDQAFEDRAAAEAALAEVTARADRLAVEVSELRAAFIQHRTATHIVAPKFCHICRESDAVLAKTITLTYLARGIQQFPPAAGEE
jgi:hypothetical protein